MTPRSRIKLAVLGFDEEKSRLHLAVRVSNYMAQPLVVWKTPLGDYPWHDQETIYERDPALPGAHSFSIPIHQDEEFTLTASCQNGSMRMNFAIGKDRIKWRLYPFGWWSRPVWWVS